MNEPVTKRLEDLKSEFLTSRELSWLSFNARVLQEADDPSVPVIQRLRYLGIFSNNLDEFFRVRVAEVRRLISLSKSKDKEKYTSLLKEIQREVARFQSKFDITYKAVLKELGRRHIYLINEMQLSDTQAQFVKDYFRKTVLPELEPIFLTENIELTGLTDELIYLAVEISSKNKHHHALVKVPTDRLPRFVQIPNLKKRGGKVFIVLENIIRFCMPEVFRGVITIDDTKSYTIKFSRDAELLEIDAGLGESFIEKMATSLKARSTAEAVRFVYDSEMPDTLLDLLKKRFKLGRYDSLLAGGRYHNSKDLLSFPNVGPKYLEFTPLPTLQVSAIENQKGSIFSIIRKKDVLLYYPYHSFDVVTDLLKTAALDPKVTCIKICLYRAAKNSRVCDALSNAVQNGKRVLAVVELQARFDEEANISWAQQLADAGVEVKFGVPGLKVHSKLLLIERTENGQRRYYSHVGTGNFNEKTARLYTDFSLLTYQQEIGKDLYNVFDFLRYNYKRPNYKHLLVSPHTSRPKITALIEQEITNARAGKFAAIIIKCNSLVDHDINMLLYEASKAGVKIKVIVRGMTSLKPNLPGLSENIEAISIVDRFLEHPRVFVFHNGGKPSYFIGSADLMTRNLDYRVEALCPILDPDHQKTLQDILDLQWNDNTKARVIDAEQSNKFAPRRSRSRIRSQEAIHKYLDTGVLPSMPKSEMTHPPKTKPKRSSKK
ncbi:polyphosphate kinase 1 [Leucothrix arctica]|uniref:Polyphosphate kinase n=1 Tax=Leucothrix arctica TaxID=1481894 RepID=A0A317C6H9_9GAMM|nr:polyphosphate kinase 1 [Leucothrix arctica]PWQ93889.1 polyphosphate kinase 1 [Leucothrix arctica]